MPIRRIAAFGAPGGGGGGPPTGPAGGDLAGTYPNPTVPGVALAAHSYGISLDDGGTANPARGVYATWASAHAAARAHADAGGHATIFITSTTAAIGAGVWNMDGIALSGPCAEGVGPVVTVADGGQLLDIGLIECLRVVFNNTGIPGIGFTSPMIVRVNRDSSIYNNGSEPVIAATVALGGFPGFSLDSSNLRTAGLGSTAIIDIESGATAQVVQTGGSCVIEAGAITGPVGASYISTFNDESFLGTGTHAGFLGGITENRLSDAQFEDYNPAVPGNWAPAPDTVSQALDQLVAGAAGKVTWAPGGTKDAIAGVYTAWSEAYAAARALADKGVRATLAITATGTVTIPVGAYNMDEIVLAANGKEAMVEPRVEVADGVVFTDLRLIDDVDMVFNNTTPAQYPMQFTAVTLVSISRAAHLYNNGTVPVMFVSVALSGSGIGLSSSAAMKRSGGILGTYEILEVDAGATALVPQLGGTTVDDDTIRGAGDVTSTLGSDSQNGSGTHTNLSGTITESFFDRARYLGYTPTTPGDWDPGTDDVRDALDQLGGAGGGGGGEDLAATLALGNFTAGTAIITADDAFGPAPLTLKAGDCPGGSGPAPGGAVFITAGDTAEIDSGGSVIISAGDGYTAGHIVMEAKPGGPGGAGDVIVIPRFVVQDSGFSDAFRLDGDSISVAVGGGSAPTLGTLPAGATAAQSQWLRVELGGTDYLVPCWTA